MLMNFILMIKINPIERFRLIMKLKLKLFLKANIEQPYNDIFDPRKR